MSSFEGCSTTVAIGLIHMGDDKRASGNYRLRSWLHGSGPAACTRRTNVRSDLGCLRLLIFLYIDNNLTLDKCPHTVAHTIRKSIGIRFFLE
jgi:hypothetical protein